MGLGALRQEGSEDADAEIDDEEGDHRRQYGPGPVRIDQGASQKRRPRQGHQGDQGRQQGAEQGDDLAHPAAHPAGRCGEQDHHDGEDVVTGHSGVQAAVALV